MKPYITPVAINTSILTLMKMQFYVYSLRQGYMYIVICSPPLKMAITRESHTLLADRLGHDTATANTESKSVRVRQNPRTTQKVSRLNERVKYGERGAWGSSKSYHGGKLELVMLRRDRIARDKHI